VTPDEEFAEFAETASPQLRRTAFLLCGNWHTAEDLVQTTLTKVFVSWRKIRRRDAVRAYAARTLVNTCLADKRSKRSTERAVVVLRYWEDLSVDQTAVVLGCSPGNVKSLAAGALGKLRVVLDDALTGYDPTEPHPEEQHEVKDTRHG
jgi:DNA-directed RNA polymerase specialized sigma24 family protein